MPKQKDLKRRVRVRMKKTGEAYTTARAQLVRKKAPAKPAPATPKGAASHAALAGMSDAAVAAKTGKNWKQWVAALDAIGAAELRHAEIARKLHDDLGVPGWWTQMVTVGYERIRGLREKGQRRGGGYEVGKSKTFAVPIAELYAAFGRRERWLGKPQPTVRKATPEKSVRWKWPDGTNVEFYFLPKGVAKSVLHVQQRGLATRAKAEEMRAFWGERLSALGELLKP